MPPPAAADPLLSKTLDLPKGEWTQFIFSGDKVVRMTADEKGGQMNAHLEAFSLGDLASVWKADTPLGERGLGGEGRLMSDPATGDWFIGTGPLSRLDIATGAVKWSAPCDQLGYVRTTSSRMLSGDRLLLAGSRKCKPGSDYDALKEPMFSLMDAQTGRILWTHETKAYEYELAQGYWARVAKLQGKRVAKDKRVQIEVLLSTPTAGEFDGALPEADRVIIVGERLEGVKLADGSSIHRTKDKVGVMRGFLDGKVFFREGGDINAYIAATGAEAWTFDLKGKAATVYTRDDLQDQGHGMPDDMNDIMISEPDIVSRVDVASGKTLYTVKRDGMNWQGSVNAVLTKGDDKIIAHDWKTGAKLWETKIGSKPIGFDVGEYLVFVDGDKIVGGAQQPPFKLTVANAKTGAIVWTRKDVDGKKINKYEFPVEGQIRLESEKGVVNLNLADGSVAAAAPAGDRNNYFPEFNPKGVTCRDFAGKLLWERRGEAFSIPRNQPYESGLAVWVTKDGTVEVIGLKDGATKWSAKVEKEPEVHLNAAATHLVVQGAKQATIVKLAG